MQRGGGSGSLRTHAPGEVLRPPPSERETESRSGDGVWRAHSGGLWSLEPQASKPGPLPCPVPVRPRTLHPAPLAGALSTDQTMWLFRPPSQTGGHFPPFHLSGALTSSCGSVRFRGACVVFVFLLSVLSSALSLPGVLTGDVRPVTDVRPSAPADPALLATSLSAPSFARALSVHQAPGLQKRPAAGLGRKSRTRLSGAHRPRCGETLAGCSPLRETRGS